ncbi:MAG: ComEC/Rec2 family competence protein [Patescibacteria group bacterium]
MSLKYKITLLLGAILVLIWFFLLVFNFDGKLRVYFLNVGQGDSVFIETPDKVQVVIDGGPDNSVLAELSSVMPFYDREIDLLIFTHPQKDHIFGLIDILKRYKVNNIMFSNIIYKNSFYDEIKKLVEEKNINRIEAKAGVRLGLGEFVYMDILYPFSDIDGVKIKNPNDISLALILNFLDKKFLFSGDAELKEELDLVNSGLNIDVDILKINHHGSKTSSTELFLEKTSPEIAVISVGKNNQYNHPSPEVLERLNKVRLFRTDLNGMVKIITDGSKLDYKTEF